jgi:hypothetical protein
MGTVPSDAGRATDVDAQTQTLQAGDIAGIRAMAVHTTRTPHPGRHAVDVIVNGNPSHIGVFQVVGAKA